MLVYLQSTPIVNCDVSQFDTFAYFYAISNFYFLLNMCHASPKDYKYFRLLHLPSLPPEYLNVVAGK